MPGSRLYKIWRIDACARSARLGGVLGEPYGVHAEYLAYLLFLVVVQVGPSAFDSLRWRLVYFPPSARQLRLGWSSDGSLLYVGSRSDRHEIGWCSPMAAPPANGTSIVA